jgi:hypothetical protein
MAAQNRAAQPGNDHIDDDDSPAGVSRRAREEARRLLRGHRGIIQSLTPDQLAAACNYAGPVGVGHQGDTGDD